MDGEVEGGGGAWRGGGGVKSGEDYSRTLLGVAYPIFLKQTLFPLHSICVLFKVSQIQWKME